MKKISLAIVLISVLITMSCDKRTSKKERLENAISEFNKNLKLDNIKSYFPKDYIEIKTDSIVSHTFKVNIRNYTSNHKEILLKTSIKNHQTISEYHRSFESEVIVSVKDKIIFKQLISAEKFRDFAPSLFWNTATLEHVWVNQYKSTAEKLSLGISFINPINDSFKLYEMQIDSHGNQRLTLIEEQS
ncbi:hypothetical protein [Psychroserpens sp. MEBiC05023]